MYSNLKKIAWQLPYKLCTFTFPWLSGHSCKQLWPDTFRVSGLTLALFLGFHTHRLHKMKSYSPLNLYFNKWTSNCCSSQWILYQFQLLLFFHRLYICIVSLLVVTIIDSLYYNCRVDSLHTCLYNSDSYVGLSCILLVWSPMPNRLKGRCQMKTVDCSGPGGGWLMTHSCKGPLFRVRKYAKFGVFYAKIVQMTPLRLRRESLRLQKFSVTNREPLRLQKFSVTHTVLSLPFSQQMQFTLIVNVANLH